jgi:predicted dehydrogenase
VSGPLRIGLVGCGRVSERAWVPALRQSEVARLVAVADSDLERCALVAPSVPAFGSAAALVADRRPDALIVATPPGEHLESARAAAEAGLPCLVEKPPAADLLSARALAALEPAPWIGFNRRFEPALERIRRDLPPAGRLTLALELVYSRAAWRAIDGSVSALLDIGVHLVDLARWLTGGTVGGVRATRVEELGAELDLELDRGTASISCRLDRPYRERVEIRDREGRTLGRYDTGGRIRAAAARLRRGGGHLLVPSLARELEAFAAAARGDPPPSLATAADGVAAMEAIDAARAAAGGTG